MTSQHVAILGAGPAGLACAHRLAERGFAVTVLEKQDAVGGLCRTTERDGFRFDLGGHRWFTRNEELQAWFLRLMEGHLVEVPRKSRILFDGRFIEYPIEIENVLRTLGIVETGRCVAAYLAASLRGALRSSAPRTLEDAFVAQFGLRLYERFFLHYTEKVWGRHPSQLSSDWASQRTKGLSLWSKLLHALRRDGGKNESLLDSFLYPRLGYQVICDRMHEEIEERGGVVLLSTEVHRVRAGAGSGRSGARVEHSVDGRLRTLSVDHVVSTIPLGVLLSRALQPAPPRAVVDAAASLEFRSVITVNLMLDRPSVTDDTWLYCHDGNLGFARLHEPRNWSPDMAPEGKTSLVLEYFCTRGDETWSLAQDELVARAVRDLEALDLLDAGDVLGGFCVRARDAYPVYDLEYDAKVRTCRAHLDGVEGVSVAGRGGTFRYNNADHSIEMGLLAADALAGHSTGGRVFDVNTSPEYGESQLSRNTGGKRA